MALALQSDLWDRAVDALSDEDKQAIDFSRTDKPAILADVLHAAEQKKQMCMQKRWKYIQKNGDVVILRDLCEKMIKWVDRFKQIGDIAVQFDQAHASLPWAAVRFFLQLSVNDVQTFGAMAEGLEAISAHITRCHLYEQLYLSKPSAARSDLELLLLRLYTAMLVYLARARHYYGKSTSRRFGSSLVITAESVDAFLSKVATEREEVERCTRLIDTELSQDTNQKTVDIQSSVKALACDMKLISVDMSTSQEHKYQWLKTMLISLEQPMLRTAAHVLITMPTCSKKRDGRFSHGCPP